MYLIKLLLPTLPVLVELFCLLLCKDLVSLFPVTLSFVFLPFLLLKCFSEWSALLQEYCAFLGLEFLVLSLCCQVSLAFSLFLLFFHLTIENLQPFLLFQALTCPSPYHISHILSTFLIGLVPLSVFLRLNFKHLLFDRAIPLFIFLKFLFTSTPLFIKITSKCSLKLAMLDKFFMLHF